MFSARDAVSEFIRLVVNTILRQEELVLVSEMVKYRKNLSQRMFSKLQGLEGTPADMRRFYDSFRADWQEWKKNRDEQKEESINIDTETILDNPIG